MSTQEDEMRPQQILVTDATVGDVVGIRHVQKETWLATYPNPALGFTREDIEAKITEMQDGDGIERLQKRILEDTHSHTWVARDGDNVIGFIGAQKGDAENKLRALYVLPEYQGKGIGRNLMQQALTWLGDDKKMSLEVVSYNTNAINFYRSFGFTEQGPGSNEAAHLPSGKELPETLMVRG